MLLWHWKLKFPSLLSWYFFIKVVCNKLMFRSGALPLITRSKAGYMHVGTQCAVLSNQQGLKNQIFSSPLPTNWWWRLRLDSLWRHSAPFNIFNLYFWFMAAGVNESKFWITIERLLRKANMITLGEWRGVPILLLVDFSTSLPRQSVDWLIWNPFLKLWEGETLPLYI